MLRSLFALPLLLLAPLAQAQSLPPEQEAVRTHVAYLASDELRGREAGTPDFDKAADYVVAQMTKFGLVPGGPDGSWFQTVPLVSRGIDKQEMTAVRGGKRTPLVAGKDFAGFPSSTTPAHAFSGGVVFAGYGVSDSAAKRDDYAGLDVKGKVVVVLFGMPKGADAALSQRWGPFDAKVAEAKKRGASGVIVLESALLASRISFDDLASYLSDPSTTLDDGTSDDESNGNDPVAFLSQAGAAKLFAGSPIDFAAVKAADKAGTAMPTGALGTTLNVDVTTTERKFTSKNVIGKLEGSDPERKDEYLVLSAHLDHVGVGKPDKTGDTIYNGAMDNAIGVATVLDMARRFQASGERPRRSLLFVGLTAEEKGLLGSRYLAGHPPLKEGEKLVGNLNFDMPIMTFPLVNIVALGEEHSTLGPAVHKAAAEVGLSVVPDPLPEENFFVRSDHYSFVQAGIPAISIDTGPGGEGAAAIKKFLADDYHKPSDQVGLINWESAKKFVDLCFTFVRSVANADDRPAWNKGDEYGLRYNGYGAK